MFVRVFVLAAFLVSAVQTSALAAYSVEAHNQTGYTWQYLSVIVNDGATADFANIQNGGSVIVEYYEYINYVSVVYTTPNGITITRDNLPIYGADVYVR